MPASRRDFLRTTIGGVACASAGGMLLANGKAGPDDKLPGAAKHGKSQVDGANAFKYRIGFGCWMNDMRCEPLPLENWPAPQFDDQCADSIIRCMDVQKEAGYNMIDVWGYFGTYGWPADVVSSMDKDRSRRLNRVLKAARDRGLTPVLGFGTYSWGYTEIINKDPSVMGKTFDGRPNPNVLCDAVPKSFDYVKKMLDFALGEYDFGGVHLESCDMGCCQCPKCTQKYGFVGYNARINAKTADYVKSKWPDHTVYSITISWLQGHPHFNAEEKAHLVELSKHVDCIFDQGHTGFHIDPAQRRDFIKQLHCAYGTSGELWLYPDVRWDRASFFLPYIKRAVTGLKNQYQDGVRACLHYQGPVSNAGTEAQIAAGGRAMSDPGKSVEDILGDVVNVYYKPKTQESHKLLMDVFLRAEECYFSNWPRQIPSFQKLYGSASYPGEFKLYQGLWGTTPGPASYLLDPMLDSKGRQVYQKGLEAILADIPRLEGKCDMARLNNIRRSIIVTLTQLNTIHMVQTWPCSKEP